MTDPSDLSVDLACTKWSPKENRLPSNSSVTPSRGLNGVDDGYDVQVEGAAEIGFHGLIITSS